MSRAMLGHTHDQVIHPFAEVTGYATQNDAQNRADDLDNEADDQRYAAAVHQAGQHVHAVPVCAQPVCLARVGIGIIDSRGGFLENGPGLQIRPVCDGVFGCDAFFIRIGEHILPFLETDDQFLLELSGQEHVGHDRLHHISRYEGNLTATAFHHTVFIDGVILSVRGEAALSVGIGQKRLILKIIAQACTLHTGADDVLVCNTQGRVVSQRDPV